MAHPWRLTSSVTEDLTPQRAAEFSQMTATVTERDLDPKRILRLKEKVLAGTAISFNWARATLTTTGEVYRANGHHSSKMLSGLDGAFPSGLKVHIDDYEVEDARTLAVLFRQFDDRKSARTVADIAGAYQGLVPELKDVQKVRARKAIEGAAWYLRKIVGDNIPKGDDVYDLFNQSELHPFILMCGRIYTPKCMEFTTAVIGAMYGSHERAPDDAEQFWTDVSREGGENVNDDKHPATALDAWLVRNKEAKDKASEMEVYRTCALAWNAYRHHRQIGSFGKFDRAKGPLDLE